MRHRNLFLIGGTLIAAGFSFYTDPDKHGLATLLGGLTLLQGVWALLLSHWARKALMDYKEADQRSLFRKAAETSVGAGLALIAIAIVFFGLLMVFAPRAQASELPAGFAKYGPVLKQEQRQFWPDHPDPATLAGLVEQESCVSLKSPKCWNPLAKLKSDREEGAGMGQITRAYTKTGALRFDSLAAMRDRYKELASWSWNNVYERPDLQLRAVVLMSRDASRPFKTNKGYLEFGDAAYNGGTAGVQKERRACQLSAGCNPDVWFKNVELHCLKSRQPIYGGRSACDINREHVKNVRLIRRAKYVPYMNGV